MSTNSRIMEQLAAIDYNLDIIKNQQTELNKLQDKLKSKMEKVYSEYLNNPKEIGIMLEESTNIKMEKVYSECLNNPKEVGIMLEESTNIKMEKVYSECLNNPKEVGIMLEESTNMFLQNPDLKVNKKLYVKAGKVQPNGLREFIKVGGKKYNSLIENDVEIDGVPLSKFYQFTASEVGSLKQVNGRVFRKGLTNVNQ